MADTSATFLDELRRDGGEQQWERLVALYAPLLAGWMDRYDVQPADADDLVQEVLLVVTRELPSFEHSGRPGAFRNWLRRIVVNRVRNFWRGRRRGDVAGGGSDVQQRLDELEDPASGLSRIWDREHDRHVTRQLLETIEARFAENTRQAFHRLVLDGADADDVAAELGMTLGAVFTAKSRVLRELRRLGRGLID